MTVQFQEALGADIIMVLDECPAHDDSFERVRSAMRRTHLWADRCRRAHKRKDQALFGIVQGGMFPEFRRQSAEFVTSLGFTGYAIGGLSLGEPKDTTLAMIEETTALLPEDSPRYLMGVGSPEDIVEAVARGCDVFDSVLPTRVARNGAFFTWQGRRSIRNAVYAPMAEALVSDCDCHTCRTFSAAYVHHLLHCEELLGYRLLTIHNLRFISNFMRKMRNAILDGTFDSFRDGFLAGYKTTDEQVRLSQKQKWLKSREQDK
jgi:queuine tRNA-ribosyltransferase